MKRLLAALGLVALAAACGADFSPKNELQTIRILAAKSDLPYAHPGETVNLEVLAADGRREAAKKPMRVFWFPAPCINPPFDQYYACYPLFSAVFPEGRDLTPALVESTKTTIHIPANALDSVVLQPGQTDRFVSAFNFVVACAGHVQRIPLKSGLQLNQVPLACFDDATGLQLPESDFVFGFTRVFVFDQRRNAVPVLDGLTFEGQPLDTTKGVTVGKCVKDSKTGECKSVKLDAVFKDDIAEIDPDNVDSNGHVLRETIYVDWFTTNGKFKNDRKIVYDGNLGRPPKTAVEYFPADDPVKGSMFAVLHDNRGGTSWVVFPLEVQ